MKKITIQSKIATLAVLGSLVLGSVPAFAQTGTDAQKPFLGVQAGWSVGSRADIKGEFRADIRDDRDGIKNIRDEIKDNRDDHKAEIINIKSETRTSVLNADGKVEIKNIREEGKKEIKESRESFKEEQKEKMQSLRESVRFMIVKELSFSYSQLNNLAARIGVKLEAMKADGVDTAKAEVSLTSAKDSLAKALVGIEKIKSILGGDQSDKETIRAEVKTGVADVKLNLQTSRQSLKASIDFIKESSRSNEKESDSQ